MSKREKRFIKAIRSYIDDRQLPYIIAIYKNPSDYPGKFVARLWIGIMPTEVNIVKSTITEIRHLIPSFYGRISSRCLNDDPVIVETWFW